MTDENFDYGKLAELIANQIKGSQEIGGSVKKLSDLKLEQLEQKLTARFDALEKENKELREANAELYAALSKQSAAAPEQRNEGTADVHAAQPVKDPAEARQEEEARKSFEEMYKTASATLGYPDKQKDGM